MKIRISKDIKQAHKKLLLLISVHPEIEESIWIARATLGIRPTDLASQGIVPAKIQKKYNLLLWKKQPYQKYFENEQKYENLEKRTGKNLSQILEENTSGIALEIMEEYIEYDKQLARQAQEVIKQHNLPGAWTGMMKTYIATGNIQLSTASELPITIKFPRKAVLNNKLGSLSMFASDDFDGINISISEFVFIEDLLNWIKDNKKVLEDLIHAFGYKKYYRPKINDNTFDEGLNLYLQRKTGKKYRKIAFEKLSKSEKINEEDGAITDVANKLMRREHKFKKTYLGQLSKKSRG